MPITPNFAGKLLAASVCATAFALAPAAGLLLAAPSAYAEGIPDPQIIDPDNPDDLQPRTIQLITPPANIGVGANLIPNINGYPCTGYWESAACYEMSQDEVPVQPHSTLSSSP